jgi:hypothetical protein
MKHKHTQFLKRVRTVAKRAYCRPSARPSVRMYQCCTQSTDFREMFYGGLHENMSKDPNLVTIKQKYRAFYMKT